MSPNLTHAAKAATIKKPPDIAFGGSYGVVPVGLIGVRCRISGCQDSTQKTLAYSTHLRQLPFTRTPPVRIGACFRLPGRKGSKRDGAVGMVRPGIRSDSLPQIGDFRSATASVGCVAECQPRFSGIKPEATACFPSGSGVWASDNKAIGRIERNDTGASTHAPPAPPVRQAGFCGNAAMGEGK